MLFELWDETGAFAIRHSPALLALLAACFCFDCFTTAFHRLSPAWTAGLCASLTHTAAMAERNPNIAKLAAGYLFPTIGKLRREYAAAHPEAKVLSLGIGDTSEPLTPSVAKAMSDYCLALGTEEGYTGYDPPIEADVKAKIAEVMYPGCNIAPEEVFVSDGSKCDLGRLQWLMVRTAGPCTSPFAFLFCGDWKLGAHRPLWLGPLVSKRNACQAGSAKVAVQDPAYPVYVDSSVMFGRSEGGQDEATGQYEGITYMPCTPANDFFPDLEPAKDCNILLFCNPNNPTGACATRAQLEQLVAFGERSTTTILLHVAKPLAHAERLGTVADAVPCRTRWRWDGRSLHTANANKQIIIYDSAYAPFIQDPDKPKSIFEIEGAKTCAIESSSLSKLAGFTGVRFHPITPLKALQS
jgi:hypothetical protein